MQFAKNALLLLMPLMLSGCATGNIIYMATHEHDTYFDDHYRQVEKAAVTPDNTLMVLVKGTPAGSKSGRYLITIPLPKKDETDPWSAAARQVVALPWASRGPKPIECAGARWDPVTNDLNCELLMETGLLAVAIAPLVTLPAHEDPYDVIQSDYQQFPGLGGAERTLYCVDNRYNDLGQQLVYVEKGEHPRKIVFAGGFKTVTTPHYYPYLFWLPLTIPADAATLPLQIIFLPVLSAGFD